MIKIGCCGFPVGRERYYKIFNCCEVQITFYTFPKISLLEKWRKEAPRDFEFIIKASQLITHPAPTPTYKRLNKEIPLLSYQPKNFGFFQPTQEVKDAWEEVLKEAQALAASIILFQTPPSFSEDPKHLRNIYSFFTTIERKGLTLAWEYRGEWQEATLKKVARDLNLILVGDPTAPERSPGPNLKVLVTSLSSKKEGPFIDFYFRLHGGKGYRHKFTDEELMAVALLTKKKTGYIMFNNMHMFEDAQRMKEIINTVRK